MMYALLPNKQRQSYNHAFSLLKDVAMTHGLDLDPVTVLGDFKLASSRHSPSTSLTAVTEVLLSFYAGHLEEGLSASH